MKNILVFLLLVLICNTSLSCNDDNKTGTDVFEIEATELEQSIGHNGADIIIPVNTTLDINKWNATSDNRWLTVKKAQKDGNASIVISVSVNTDKERIAKVTVASKLQSYTINVTQSGEKELVVEGDIQIKPYGGKDSEHQSGQDISNTYDGKFSIDGGNPFHTPWGTRANFPVTLEYYFRGDMEIDYLVYHTRSGSGNFGELEIWTATDKDRNNYVLEGNYNFRKQSSSSKIILRKPTKATGIKFIVKSGLDNFVSCDEMQFFKKNEEKTLPVQLLTVFTDITCTALKPGITQADINALPTYFVRVAEALRDNTYDAWEKKFRIQNYEAYSDVEQWAEKLSTSRYSNLDNPTGIYVERGDEIVVLTGDTYGQEISIQCIGEAGVDYLQVPASGDTYFLKSGLNKLTMRGSGQLFLIYNTDLTSPNAKPIKIHIPLGSGKVTGFFDLKNDKTNEVYAELLSKATHKYFCVRGERIMFYFHRSKMLEHVSTDILSAINLWDNIVGWQQEMMGIEKLRPQQVNNHIMAISPEGGYMWASDYQIGFVYTYLGYILLYDNVMAAEDNAWGPAHEIGHLHQHAINWSGSTESSNNLFSNYVIYKLGKYSSRGFGLSRVANSIYGDGRAWWNVGAPANEAGHTEVQMRMNWQLWIYYELSRGSKGKLTFWPEVFRIMRDKYSNVPNSTPGARQLAFVKAVCEAAQEDLTDFFETWGFFKPVDTNIEHYGTHYYLVTEQMIKDTKAEISRYPKAAPVEYIEDRKTSDFTPSDYRYEEIGDVGYYTQFKENMKITKTPTATLSGRRISISGGEQAVAFEIRKTTDSGIGKLLYFSNTFKFEIPASISINGVSLYAVQSDGVRKLIISIP